MSKNKKLIVKLTNQLIEDISKNIKILPTGTSFKKISTYYFLKKNICITYVRYKIRSFAKYKVLIKNILN